MMNKLWQAALLFTLIIAPLANAVLEDDIHDEDEDAPVVLLYMFFGLVIGVIIFQGLATFGEAVPYTVVVFIVGIVTALIASSSYNKEETLDNSIESWVRINADLMLFVFLPPLIFGEAMSLNWHHVKGGILQSTILAGPGVLIGAALMGTITKMILPYDWSWTLAMTFGSILSATDPVAVVALLKSAGASPKLTILIVGESLLNDGAAMVLFELFFNMLNGQVYNAGDIVEFFIQAALGSVLLGIGFGLVTVRWLRSANNPLKETDVTVQVAITICCAYLCFFTAQYSCDMSGVLACCAAGAMVAWLGPPIILDHETMHKVWGMMEWGFNTLIFLLAGLIIGHHSIQSVQGIDWLYMIALYAVLMSIRVVVIAILFPVLSRIGHKLTFVEAIFMAWAGLRGALGMALALIVQRGTDEDMSDETNRFFFYVGGIAALTLIINATTAKQLLVFLGLLGNDSVEKNLVVDSIKRKLRLKMAAVIEEMSSEFTATDLNEVRLSVSLLNDVNMNMLYRDSERMSELLAQATAAEIAAGAMGAAYDDRKNVRAVTQSADNGAGEGSSGLGGGQRSRAGSFSSVGRAGGSMGKRKQSFNAQESVRVARLLTGWDRGDNTEIIPQVLLYVRSLFLEIVRVQYWHDIEGGRLPRLSHSAQYLLYSIDVGLDEVELGGSRDWDCVEKEIDSIPMGSRFLLWCEDHLPLACANFCTKEIAIMEAKRDKRAVYMLTSFITAHEHAQKKIHAFVGVDEADDTVFKSPEELKVVEESAAAVARARERLQNMDYETVSDIKAKQAARLVLAKEAEMVRNMVNEGLLPVNHAEEFLEEIGKDTEALEKHRNEMYRELAEKNALRRKATVRQSLDMRGSFLGTATSPLID